MRLDDARLCLDCEEIHEEQECPGCGSEAFAFLTRWIPSTKPTRPSSSKGAAVAPPARKSSSGPTREYLDTWRQIVDGTPAPNRGAKILTRGLLGLAAMGLAGWAWSKTARSKEEDS
jgi:hypothetical protein